MTSNDQEPVRILRDALKARCGGEWTVTFDPPHDAERRLVLNVFRVRCQQISSGGLGFEDELRTDASVSPEAEVGRLVAKALHLLGGVRSDERSGS